MSDYVWPGNSNRNKMWYLENNPVPRDLKLEYVYERLKFSLALKGLEGSLEFRAFVANSKYWKPIPGVEIVGLGLSTKKKNASDNAIIEDMIKFLNRKNEPKTRQTALFSATQTSKVQDFARVSLTSPVLVNVDDGDK